MGYSSGYNNIDVLKQMLNFVLVKKGESVITCLFASSFRSATNSRVTSSG